MVLKKGFGIEYETHLVKNRGNGTFGYDNPTKTVTGFSNHNDPTVFTSREFVSRNPNESPKAMVNNILKSQNNSGDITYAPFGTVLGNSNYGRDGKGPGSYHLNITMPYDPERVSNNQYYNKYNKSLYHGVKCLRLVSPLIMAMTGGNTEASIGRPSIPEGSIRQYVDEYANIGGTGLDEDAKLRSIGRSIPEGSFWELLHQRKLRNGAIFGKYNNHFNFNELKQNLSGDLFHSSREKGDFTIKALENSRGERRIKTIEFRLMDTFHASGLYEYIKFVLLCICNGQRLDVPFKDARKESVWKEASARIMEEGWNAQVDIRYFKLIEERMNLNLNLPSDINTYRADLGFEKLKSALFNKNKNSEWYKEFIEDSGREPQPHNFSRDNWEFNYKIMLNKSEPLKNKTIEFLKDLGSINTKNSNGWMRVQVEGTKIVVRDLITNRFGLEYSAEDYHDILFLFESEGLLKIKQMNNGEIDKIKLMENLSDRKINTKINNMMKCDSYFSDDRGLMRPDSRRQREERTPTVTSEPVREETPTTSTTREANLLREVLLQVRSDMLGGDSEDIADVFKEIAERAYLRQFNKRIKVRGVFFVYNTENQSSLNSTEKRLIGQANNVGFFQHLNPDSTSSIKEYDLFISQRDLMNMDVDETPNWVEIWAGVFSHAGKNYVFKSSTSSDNRWVSGTSLLQNVEQQNQFVEYAKADANALGYKASRGAVELNRAGMRRLNEKGVYLGSIGGRRYLLVNKSNYDRLKRRHGDSLRIIKNMPYYKNYKAIIRQNTVTLLKNGVKVQTLEV